MKGSSLNTHLGSITIDNEVIAQYAGTVAVECFGIVGMAGINVKDGLVRLLKKDSLTRVVCAGEACRFRLGCRERIRVRQPWFGRCCHARKG